MRDDDFEGAAGCGCIVLFLAGLVIAGMIGFFAAHSSERTVTITVMKVESHCNGSDCKYLVFTKNADGTPGTVYEDTDAWEFGKFNSSDVYAQLQSNHTYKADVEGWRNGFLSWYPNILSVEEVKNAA